MQPANNFPNSPPTPGTIIPASQAMLTGLRLLLQAEDYAHAGQCPVWDFAVEISALRAAGFTNNDLRWLMRQGHVRHAVEKTRPGGKSRRFGRPGGLIFPPNTCVVLTEEGIAFATAMRPPAAVEQQPGSAGLGLPKPIGFAPGTVPSWNGDLHELHFGGRLVKDFERPAPSQEIVLAAFEEDGWPPRIDNPISPRDANDDVQERLHRAINKLNGNQVHPVLWFRRDGTGEGARWAIRNGNETGSKPDRD